MPDPTSIAKPEMPVDGPVIQDSGTGVPLNESFADVGRGVTLCYEAFGDPADPAVLLVMGLATQMIGWQHEFCNQLAECGFHVIRYDNRDIGRSTHLDGVPMPSTLQIMTRRFDESQYTLDDMADDAVGLLDALDIGAAHVVGVSMGGMIAQNMAALHSSRVRSLTSMMSTTGSRTKGQPTPSALRILLRRPATDKEGFARNATEVFSVIGSPEYEHDEGNFQELVELSWERGHGIAGPGRQLAAIIKSGNRTPLLRKIDVPTTVIHGASDRLVHPSGGKATAAAIPGARLVMIPGMGHDMPREVWPTMIGEIANQASRVDAAAVGAHA